MKKILVLLFICISFSFANIGKITTLKGTVEIQRGADILKNIKTGDLVEKDDTIQTLTDGKLQIQFEDNTIVTLGKNSKLNVADYLFDDVAPKANFNVLKGAFKIITGKIGKINPNKFKIKTKSASIGIRGTITLGNTQPEGDTIACTQGKIVVENEFGSVEVPAGQVTQVTPDAPPPPPQPLTTTQQESMESDSGGDLEAPADEPEAQGGGDNGDEEQAAEDDGDNPDGGGTVTQSPDKVQTEIPNVQIDTIDGVTINKFLTDGDGGVSIIGSGTGSDTGKTMSYTDYIHAASFNLEKVTSGGTEYYFDGVDSNSFYEQSTNEGSFAISRGLLSGSDNVVRYTSSGSSTGISRPLTITNLDLSSHTPTDSYSGFILGASSTFDLEIKDSSGNLLTGSDGTPLFSGMTTKTYADDMLEFIVQEYYKKDITYNGASFDYEGYLILGEASTFSALPTTGWSIYGEPSSTLKVDDKIPLNDRFANTPFVSTNNYEVYSTSGTLVNWATKDVFDFSLENDSFFLLIGDVVPDNDGKAKITGETMEYPTQFKYLTTNTYNKDHAAGTVSGFVYGSKYQGFGVTHTRTTEYSASQSYTNTEGYYGYRNTSNGSDSTPTENMDYIGYSTLVSSFEDAGSTDTYGQIGGDARISLQRKDGVFLVDKSSTYISNYSTTDKISIDSSYKSAYITDDSFAISGLSGGVTIDGNHRDLVSGSKSYLVAIDTDAALKKNTGDDEMSWGYWGAEIDDKTIIMPSTWIVGNPAHYNGDTINTVHDLLSAWNNNTNATFTGNVIGSHIINNNINSILINDTNSITMNMTIDSTTNTIALNNSQMKFDYSGASGTGSVNVNFATTGTGGLITENNNGLSYEVSAAGTNVNLNFKGRFFGPNANGTGGSFHMQNTSTNGNTSTNANTIGSFKATKQ